jgi:hypothetical protein
MGAVVVLCSISWGAIVIRVLQQPEPVTFSAGVRVPGNTFLRGLRRAPSKQEWSQNNFWRYCITDLQTAYRDVCAFTSCWLPDSASVDHFMPKTRSPNLAYEWSNYRLASQKVNSKKGNATVLDPFTIDDTWFILDFGSSMVRPSRQQPTNTQAIVQQTITTLGLNDRTWIRVRFTVLRQYANLKVTFDYLQECYPFIARELDRQGLKQSIIGTVP